MAINFKYRFAKLIYELSKSENTKEYIPYCLSERRDF